MPSERPLVAAVIYNRLHDGMPLGIDATLRYGLHIPPTESIHESQLQNPTPYNTRLHYGLPPTPIANPGSRLDPGRRASGEGRLPLLRAQARPPPSLLHGERDRVQPVPRDPRLRMTQHVALLGHPVAHSLSPRMQNAAFAALGLDWEYEALDVEDVVAAVADLQAARLRRRERDDPAQAGGCRGVRRGGGRRRQHARLPRRTRARLQHRQGDPGGYQRDACVRDRRRRRCAGARSRRCPPTHVSSRAAATGRRTPTAAT